MKCIICGKGGQGVITLNYNLGYLASALGYKAISSETHGMAMRGGSVYTTLIIGDADSASVLKGSADLILSTDSSEAMRNVFFLHNNGVIISDGHIEHSCPFESIFINAMEISVEKFGSPTHGASVLLGKTIARFKDIFPIERTVEILSKNKKININALNIGLGQNV